MCHEVSPSICQTYRLIKESDTEAESKDLTQADVGKARDAPPIPPQTEEEI